MNKATAIGLILLAAIGGSIVANRVSTIDPPIAASKIRPIAVALFIRIS
jgi:hypothetical protein